MPGDNPFSGFAEGMNQGVSWAVQKNQLDNQRQQLDLNRQYLDETKRQFNVKVGKDFNDMIAGIVTEPSEKVRKTLIEGAKNYVQQTNGVLNVDEPFWTALNDEEHYIPKFKQLLSGIVNLNPEEMAEYYSSIAQNGHFSGKELTNQLDKGIQGISSIIAGRNKLSIAQDNLTFRKQGRAQQQIGKMQDQYGFMLNGAARSLGILDKLSDPNLPDDQKLAATKQMRTFLSGEMARLQTQKQNFGEGTMERTAIDSYENTLNDFKTKILNQPVGELSPEFIQQEKNTLVEFTKQYMEAHDRDASNLMSQAVDAQKPIIMNRAKSFQNQYGKAFQKYGGWQGQGFNDGSGNIIKPDSASKSNSGQGDEEAPINPQQMQQALKLKQAFNGMKDAQTPEGKAQFNAEMKKRFPKNILKKLGIE